MLLHCVEAGMLLHHGEKRILLRLEKEGLPLFHEVVVILLHNKKVSMLLHCEEEGMLL